MNRTTIDLDGMWDFVADLDPKYHAIHGGYERPEISRRHWLKAPVPGVWQKLAERYDIYEGVCWYARAFEAPELPPGATARLRFGGVNYLCRVYLNGQFIGAHEGGYTAFEIDCAAALKPGRNHIAVQVDNRATTIKWPPCLGYFNYGGIHRSVRLEICAGPTLSDLRLHAIPTHDGGELIAQGRARDMRPGLIVRARSGDRAWEDFIGSDGAFELRAPFFDTPAWSPDNPHLEAVTIELLDEARAVLDSHEFECGFRALEMKAGADGIRRVHLNGEPITLKGICYVYDSPVTGLVMTPAQVEADLRLMKQMGCNAVRCHYPMDECFYAAADRLGLLVWIEPPTYCYHPGDQETNTCFVNPAWRDLAQGMAREMVAGARNHACVVLYGIGNECNTHNPEAAPFFRALADVIRAEDPTRLISYAALYGIIGPIADMVDVLGVNSYWGWYDQIDAPAAPRTTMGDATPRPIDLSPMRRMLDDALARQQNLALLLTEFGADSVAGFHSRSRDLWSEDYHAELLRAIFALAETYPQIVGTFPFCFSDYRDPSKVHNGYWNELNLKGMVDYARRPKLAFTALADIYNNTRSG